MYVETTAVHLLVAQASASCAAFVTPVVASSAHDTRGTMKQQEVQCASFPAAAITAAANCWH
jgi:hypothetical protein